MNVTTVKCSYFGARFIVDIRDLVGFEIATGRLEFGDISKMLAACAKIRPTAFIDVGANIGLYSCIAAAQRVAPRIIAFEPDPRNFSGLKKNITLNRFGDLIEARPHAVGDSERQAFLSIAPIDNTGLSAIESNGTHSVQMTSLDRALPFRGEKIVIKIDVEGYESSVLHGATDLLSLNTGFAIIEARDDIAASSTTEFIRHHGWSPIERHGLNLMFEKAT